MTTLDEILKAILDHPALQDAGTPEIILRIKAVEVEIVIQQAIPSREPMGQAAAF